MTEILSLSKARKARSRAEDRRRAEENRAKHGLTKSERRAHESKTELELRRLEAHRRAGAEVAPRPEDDAPRD